MKRRYLIGLACGLALIVAVSAGCTFSMKFDGLTPEAAQTAKELAPAAGAALGGAVGGPAGAALGYSLGQILSVLIPANVVAAGGVTYAAKKHGDAKAAIQAKQEADKAWDEATREAERNR